MPTYIIGSRDTGPSLADFLTGVNQSIGLYADQRNNQIKLDQAAAAAQAEQDRWNDEYMLKQQDFGLQRRKFNEYDLPMLGVNQFEAQTGRQRLGLDRDIYENVSLPGVRIDQQNADTTRMTENRAGALQDRRFGLVDQAASAPETMRDVLAFQSSLLEGSPTAGLVPATARANRADTLSQTALRDFQRNTRQGGYDYFSSVPGEFGAAAALSAAEGREIPIPSVGQANLRETRLGNATAAQDTNMGAWQQGMLGVPDVYGAMPEQSRPPLVRAPDGSVQMGGNDTVQQEAARNPGLQRAIDMGDRMALSSDDFFGPDVQGWISENNRRAQTGEDYVWFSDYMRETQALEGGANPYGAPEWAAKQWAEVQPKLNEVEADMNQLQTMYDYATRPEFESGGPKMMMDVLTAIRAAADQFGLAEDISSLPLDEFIDRQLAQEAYTATQRQLIIGMARQLYPVSNNDLAMLEGMTAGLMNSKAGIRQILQDRYAEKQAEYEQLRPFANWFAEGNWDAPLPGVMQREARGPLQTNPRMAPTNPVTGGEYRDGDPVTLKDGTQGVYRGMNPDGTMQIEVAD